MARNDRLRYFGHDTDMRNDLKIRGIRRKFGNEGYAVWGYMLEVLTASADLSIDIEKMGGLLAADFEVSEEWFRSFINYCLDIELFQLEGTMLYSRRHRERLGYYDKRDKEPDSEAAKRRSERARKAITARWARQKGGNEEADTQNTEPIQADTDAIRTDTEAVRTYTDAIRSDTAAEYGDTEAVRPDTTSIRTDTEAVSSDTDAIRTDTDRYLYKNKEEKNKEEEQQQEEQEEESASRMPSMPTTSVTGNASPPQGTGAECAAPQSAEGRDAPPSPPKAPPRSASPSQAEREAAWHAELVADRTFAEMAAQAIGLSTQRVREWLDTFRAECLAKGARHDDPGHYRRHAFDWLRAHKAYNTPKPSPANGTKPQTQSRHRVVERMASSDADYRVTAL